jgi:ankyrin repeat protein
MLDSNGWTALHHAAFNGDLTSVDQLLQQRANVDSFSNQYKTPLHFAALNNHAHVVASLLESGCNPEAKDEQQCTPLHLACKKGGQECLELLLRRGANLMAPDNRQWTALHYAAYNGHPRAANFLLKWEADDDKLSFVKNSQGRTAFIIAKDDRVKKAFNRKYTRHLHMITLSIFYRHLEIQ